jgi:hypothetical protein
MRQGGYSIDVLDALDERANPFQRFAGELADLRERWNNRLVLELCSLAEQYVNGRLEIVTYGDWRIGLEQYHWACRIKADAAVLKGVCAGNNVDIVDTDDCDKRNEVIVLVVLVEGAKVPKALVRSVFRPYLFKKQFCKTGDGLLYRRESGMGYEVFPFRDGEVKRSFGAGSPGINDCARGMVKRFADIPHGGTDNACEDLWDALFGPEGYLHRCRIVVNDRRAFLGMAHDDDFIQFPVQGGTSLSKLIDVAVGPLNL